MSKADSSTARILSNRWSCTVDLLVICSPMIATWFAFSHLNGWPQNDDPFYGRPVQFLTEEGRWQLVRQQGHLTASSVGHILTGMLICSIGEYSYRNLFLACLVQQLLAAAAVWWTCRQVGAARTVALVTACALTMSPLYFGHSFTFMTDGPATAWSALACCAVVLGLAGGSTAWLLVGSLAIGWGFWIRQTNLLLILIPLIGLFVLDFGLIRAARNCLPGRVKSDCPLVIARRNLRQTGFAVAGTLLAVVALESGWFVTSSLERMDDIAPRTVGQTRIKDVAIGFYGCSLLIGWLCLPLLPWLMKEIPRAVRQLSQRAQLLCHSAASVTVLLLLIPLMLSQGRACLTSATGTFIQNAHFGPIFLSDMDEPGRWGDLGGVTWPLLFWQLLTVVSIGTVGLLAWWGTWTTCTWLAMLCGRGGVDATQQNRELIDPNETEPDRVHRMQFAEGRVTAALSLLLVTCVSIVLVLFFVQPLMDRYWMFLFPVILIWLGSIAGQSHWNTGSRTVAVSAAILAMSLTISIVFTHDLLAWNDARWTYVNSQIASGLSAEQIDGGRDVNAWFRMAEDPDTQPRPGDSSAWWSGHARRCIATGPRPGWKEIDRISWSCWANLRTHSLIVLEKEDP